MRTVFQALLGLAAVTATALPALAASAPSRRIELAMSALGDLGSYRMIAQDTLTIVDKGDLAGAKTRIKDLETKWDDAEATMKPKDRTTWSSVDKAIDMALNALRAPAPKQADCAAALKALITRMDDVNRA